MDLGPHETELSPMPISSSYHAPPHESTKLKLLTSGNRTSMEEVSEFRPPEPSAVSEKPATIKKGTVRYRECHKNHAAGIGGHAIDGCGEFMPGCEDGTVDALRCAACDCHRNFHRREVEGEVVCDCKKEKRRLLAGAIVSQGITLALPPSTQIAGHPTAPLMIASSTGAADSDDQDGGLSGSPSAVKKRFRTKFSTEQKEKMWAFSEKLGWKIQKHDEASVQEFCASLGVRRHVLKVWMHNNKVTVGKKI